MCAHCSDKYTFNMVEDGNRNILLEETEKETILPDFFFLHSLITQMWIDTFVLKNFLESVENVIKEKQLKAATQQRWNISTTTQCTVAFS